MSKLYRIDIPVWATAYIKAETEAEAMGIATEQIASTGIEVPWPGADGSEFDGRQFQEILEDPDYVWSLSPAMTVDDRGAVANGEIEEVEE